MRRILALLALTLTLALGASQLHTSRSIEWAAPVPSAQR
jgi:hypothetical protein